MKDLIYFNCGERYELKPEKKISGQNGIRTHDLCDTGAELYQLSYQAKWELVTLLVRNIPVEGEGMQMNI